MKKIMMLVIACMGVLFLAGCSDDPQDVAKKWAQALEKQDLDTANKYSTDEAKFVNSLIIDAVKRDHGKVKSNIKEMINKIPKSKVEINDDKAVIKIDEDDKKSDIQLKKVDGEWKIHVSK